MPELFYTHMYFTLAHQCHSYIKSDFCIFISSFAFLLRQAIPRKLQLPVPLQAYADWTEVTIHLVGMSPWAPCFAASGCPLASPLQDCCVLLHRFCLYCFTLLTDTLAAPPLRQQYCLHLIDCGLNSPWKMTLQLRVKPIQALTHVLRCPSHQYKSDLWNAISLFSNIVSLHTLMPNSFWWLITSPTAYKKMYTSASNVKKSAGVNP